MTPVESKIIEIDLNKIMPNPYQPRKAFSKEELYELSESIKQLGVLSPVIVREKDGYYELIAGERRIRASALAGIRTIPSIIIEATDSEMAQIALVENLQRENLNVYEEALGYERLQSEFKLTQKQIADRVGKSQSAIANKMRLLKLSPDILSQYDPNEVSERHLRALLKLESEKEQLFVYNQIRENSLTVSQTEDLVGAVLAGAMTVNYQQSIGIKTHRLSGDMRIYFNTIKQAVETIKNAGVDTKIDRDETENEMIITIRVHKP